MFLKFCQGVRSYVKCSYHKIIIINKEGGKKKEGRRKLGSDGYVHDLDGSDGFMDIYLLPNSSSCIYSKCTAFCTLIIPQ